MAAVHLNRRRMFRDSSALLWFKTQTIKHANERMNNPAEGASDEMIMVALILLYFNVSIYSSRNRNMADKYWCRLEAVTLKNLRFIYVEFIKW